MKILYIWDGAKALPGNRLGYIRQTQKVYPDAEYSVVTRLDSFLPGFSVIRWDVLMLEMLNGLGIRHMPYNWMNPVTFSDWARFWILGHQEKTLYLDTDAQMEKAYPFGGEMVHSPGNICLMYSGKDGGQLLGLLRSRKYIGQLMPLHSELKSTPIPKEYFTHAH